MRFDSGKAENVTRLHDPGNIVFDVDSTLTELWRSDDFFQFVIGPLGSTKTTNCIMKLLTYAKLQQPGPDGFRRTRYALARPTLTQLKSTVLQDIIQWFSPIIRYKVSDHLIEVRTGDVISDWYMIPLETGEDQRRLLSMQLSGVYLNEFREIPLSLMIAAAGRVNRFPSKAHGGCTFPFVLGDSNPPNEGSDWHKFLVRDKPERCTYVHQPSGLSPKATWRRYLPADYYELLRTNHNPDWEAVHIDSQWGKDLSGTAVFRNNFAPDFHIRRGLQVNPMLPLLLSGDWGRTPAVLIAQMDPRGRLIIFKEVTGENMGVELFCTREVIPILAQEPFRGLSHNMTGDPSGTYASDTSEEAVFQILQRLGFKAIPAPTNNIDARLRAVEALLMRVIGGEPGILIDPEGCPLLVKALSYEYRYRRKKTGEMEDKPDKTHPWSDLADALQYLALSVTGGTAVRYMRSGAMPRKRATAPFSSAAWT